MTENQIENYLVSQCKKRGAKCCKLALVTGRGFPDRTIIGRGWICFVELKTKDGTLSAQQEGWLSDLRKLGHMAKVVNSKEAVDQLLEELFNRENLDVWGRPKAIREKRFK